MGLGSWRLLFGTLSGTIWMAWCKMCRGTGRYRLPEETLGEQWQMIAAVAKSTGRYILAALVDLGGLVIS